MKRLCLLDPVLSSRKDHIYLFFSYLREAEKKNNHSFRDFEAINEILNVAISYRIIIDDCMIADLARMNEEIFHLLGITSKRKYDEVLNKLNDYRICVSREYP